MCDFEIWNTLFKIDKEICQVYRFDKRTKKWNSVMNNKPHDGYIRITLTNNEKQTRNFRLHRIIYYAFNSEWDIMDSSINNFIDHIDRNPLNNHISNLRVVTNKQNTQNKTCEGYCYDKSCRKYIARICIEEKQYSIGQYENKNDAKLMYLIAKDKIYKTLVDKERNEIEKLRKSTNLDIDKLVDKYIINYDKPKYKGFYYNKRRNKYQARIFKDGKQIHLGYYQNESDARASYLQAKEKFCISLSKHEQSELKLKRDTTNLDIDKYI